MLWTWEIAQKGKVSKSGYGSEVRVPILGRSSASLFLGLWPKIMLCTQATRKIVISTEVFLAVLALFASPEGAKASF